jgi:hypothetical protein
LGHGKVSIWTRTYLRTRTILDTWTLVSSQTRKRLSPLVARLLPAPLSNCHLAAGFCAASRLNKTTPPKMHTLYSLLTFINLTTHRTPPAGSAAARTAPALARVALAEVAHWPRLPPLPALQLRHRPTAATTHTAAALAPALAPPSPASRPPPRASSAASAPASLRRHHCFPDRLPRRARPRQL